MDGKSFIGQVSSPCEGTWRHVPRHGIDMGRIVPPFSCRLVVLSSCIRDWRSLGKVRENEEDEEDEEEEAEEEEKQQVRVWTVSDLGLQIPFHDKTKAWYGRTR